MKRLKKLAASSAVTIAALVLAVALLGFSTIGGARAALTYRSENYITDIRLLEIGVSLYEKDKNAKEGETYGKPVATGSALQTETLADKNTNNDGDKLGLLSALKDDFHPGVKYPEELRVHNATGINRENESGERITQYVRVTITRYWEDKAGHRLAKLDPAYIKLFLKDTELSTADGAPVFNQNGWLEDTGARTEERMVLYYRYPVTPNEGSDFTEPFADTFMIDGRAATDVDETEKTVEGGTLVTRTYRYDDATFHLEIRVDAVQDHHVADAMLSAWGRTATFIEGKDKDGNPILILDTIK